MSYLSDLTAAEWLDAFMQAQAHLAAQSLFVTFGLGQLGAAAVTDPTRARAMIAALRTDAADIERDARELARVLRSIVANVERKLAEPTP